MARKTASRPLRILLACARPLVLQVHRWEAELKEPASAHLAAVATALDGMGDMAGFSADGRSIRFTLYPPGPPRDLLQEQLSRAAPLKRLDGRLEAIPLPVGRFHEELEALRQALHGLSRGRSIPIPR